MSVTELLPLYTVSRDFGAWIPELVCEHPDYDEYDLASLVEERSRAPVTDRDFETIRGLYLRTKLRDSGSDEELA
jgi:hypothetical protein